MPTSASPSSRPSSPNEPAQPSPLPKTLPLPAAGFFLLLLFELRRNGADSQNDPFSSVTGGQFAALATKLAHLLRLTRYPRPYPRFVKNCKRSTCGFVFAPWGMVRDGQLNVVDGPISWHAGHAATRCASCRSVFRWVGILPSAIQAGLRRYPNAGQWIDSKERRARDDSWASCPDN